MSALFPSFFDTRKTNFTPATVATVATVATNRHRESELSQLSQLSQGGEAKIDRDTKPFIATVAGRDRENGAAGCDDQSTPASSIEPWQTRFAILERAGLPPAWAEPFAKLLCGPPPGDFDHAFWSRVVKGATIFAELWAVAAYRARWKAADTFGLDEIKPAARHDHKGVAWFLADGRRVVALDETGADIVTRQGSRQRFYRSPIKACG